MGFPVLFPLRCVRAPVKGRYFRPPHLQLNGACDQKSLCLWQFLPSVPTTYGVDNSFERVIRYPASSGTRRGQPSRALTWVKESNLSKKGVILDKVQDKKA